MAREFGFVAIPGCGCEACSTLLTDAGRRAKELLETNLSPAQLVSFKSKGFFFVLGKKARYRIRSATINNIDLIDASGRVTEVWCVGPQFQVPLCDTVLAQKLWLENDEDKVRNIANRRPFIGDKCLPAVRGSWRAKIAATLRRI